MLVATYSVYSHKQSILVIYLSLLWQLFTVHFVTEAMPIAHKEIEEQLNFV